MNITLPKPAFRPASESGYTLLEGLMAVVVVAVLVSAIGPVVAFSVGTRVQAKRTELATQAAKTYIDAVKANPTDNTPKHVIQIRNTPTQPFTVGNSTWKNAAAPNTTLTENNQDGYISNTATLSLYCVNMDDKLGCQTDSPEDMVVQGYRTQFKDPTANPNEYQQGYYLGVRVYRANSFASGVGTLKASLPSTYVTNALGDRTRPLVSMTTEVIAEPKSYWRLTQ